MKAERAGQITLLLRAWHDGDSSALNELVSQVHTSLRRVAGRQMAREQQGHLLQKTALINETYLRLVSMQNVDWQDQHHFFAVSSQVMRHVLTDYARAQKAARRGNAMDPLRITAGFDLPLRVDRDLVAIDDALRDLEKIDARKSKVVELKFFGGLSLEEIAPVLHVSEITVRRDWQFARSWLYRALSGRTPE